MVLIGVTPTQNDQNGQITINPDYMDAVRRAGGLPVLLPLYADEASLRAVLAHVDGLVLTGGADVDPALYGEEKLPCCGDLAPERDKMESALCRMALAMDKPLLAICRGHQMLNVALGGSLYQDIAEQFGTAIRHPRSDVPRTPVHAVAVAPGSLLHQAAGQDTLQVNSRHHQGVKRLAPGAAACGVAEDGLIEAIEVPGKRFVLGVQWHPESMSAVRPEAQALFNALVKSCRETA